MALFLLLFMIVFLGMLLNAASSIKELKKECELHKWEYLEGGGMKCSVCQFIAGVHNER